MDSNSTFGVGTGPVWMDGLECNGEEDDLSMCIFTGWSNNNCSHTDDVGIECGKLFEQIQINIRITLRLF